ncbi:ABC transporter, solute-binding protein, partial [Ostertagia ostertagi]
RAGADLLCLLPAPGRGCRGGEGDPMKRFLLAAFALLLATGAQAAETVIKLSHFFGVCEAGYGRNLDLAKASGECPTLTTLVNRFNAEHRGRWRVQMQVMEHSSYYPQLGARLVGRDVPAISIMHASQLNDFVKRGLIEPLDGAFKASGIASDDFTPHARTGAMRNGAFYALPVDSHAWLWHFNTKLMAQAGLLDAKGEPVVPHSPAELIEQARRFKAATGKPYLAWMTANDTAFFGRTLINLVAQQGGSLFPRSPQEIDLQSPEVAEALRLFRALEKEGLTTRDMDYSAAVQAFMNGQVGMMINGTWLLGALNDQAHTPGTALQGAYRAVPFPQLYARPAVWADSHAWVMFKGGTKTAEQRAGALAFLKHWHDHDVYWAVTGQLPARMSSLKNSTYLSLPQRREIAPTADIGVALPPTVSRQSRIIASTGEAFNKLVVGGGDAAVELPQVQTSLNRMLAHDAQFMNANKDSP